MKVLPKNLRLKFSLLQMTYWCANGTFGGGFGFAYLIANGFSATMLGFVIVAHTIGSSLGQIFWGYVCDKLKTNKKIYMVNNIIMLLIYISIFMAPKNGIMIPINLVLGFVQTPLIANLDTWIIKKIPKVYGSVRSCGSFAYAVYMLVIGKCIDIFGFEVMLVFAGIFVGLTVIIAALTEDAPLESFEKKEQKGSLSKLFKDKSFVYILMVLFLIGFTSTPFMQFQPVVLESVSAPIFYMGLCGFAAAMSQVPFMHFSHKLARFTVYGRMLSALVLYFTSLTILVFANHAIVVVFASVINGIGFGILLPAYRQAVTQISPPELQTTAQGVSDTFQASLGGTFSGFIGGIIIDNVGMKIFIAIMMAIQLVPIAMLYVKTRKKMKQEA